MTLRIIHPNGSVETWGDERVAETMFELYSGAAPGDPMYVGPGGWTLSTGDGRPVAWARNGFVEYRDHVLAGTVAAGPATERPPIEIDGPFEGHRPGVAWAILAVLLVFAVLAGSIASSGV